MTLLVGYPQPLVGKMLAVGEADDNGDDTPCPFTAEQIERRIRFVTAVPPEPGFRFIELP